MQRLLLSIILIGALAVILPAVSQADRLVEPYNTGDWNGGAYQTDDNEDAYCALAKDFGGGAVIWLGIDSRGPFMKIFDPEYLDLQTEGPFETGLTVDAYPSLRVPAVAEDPDTLVLDFADRPEAMARLAGGFRLILDSWGIWYRLDGTRNAVAALDECFEIYR